MPKISSATAILDEMIGTDILLREAIAEQRINTHVARMVYEARTSAGLSQTQLAKKIGVKKSVIEQLEDADYEGNSLTILQRIGEALGRKVSIEWATLVAPDGAN